MPTLAMYDKGYEHIGKRFEALKLPGVKVITFGKDSRYDIDGRKVAPGEVEVDYLWLNQGIGFDGFQEGAFELALATKRVGVLQTYNAGLDHPFYAQISAKGTRICNSSAQAVAISEYIFAQVLAVMHPIDKQRANQKNRVWEITRYPEISQTTWLVVGFGPIGRELSKRLKAFGAQVHVVRRSPSAEGLADKVGTLGDLPTMLPTADVIVFACPLNAQTRGLADSKFFAAAKKGAIVVNIARGPIIDDDALMAALDAGQLSAAVLDVFHEEPLPTTHAFWGHPKVRMTSHTAFGGSGVRDRWDGLFLDNIQRFVKGEALVNEVDPKSLL
jgi:phosphoglycerate dehydrogenase-like enzyme